MDKVRFVLGVMLVVGVPPAIVFWLIIHPMVGFWRRVRPGIAYAVVGTLCGVLGFVFYHFRSQVLGADLGTNWILVFLGAIPYAVSAWISILTKRHLKTRIFAGLQELSDSDSGGVLLQEGVYAVVRHPRYLSVIIGTTGFAMVVNYVGGYLMVLGSIPALFLVVLLEERELAARFGAAFEEYRLRVPAIIPRLPKRSEKGPEEGK